MLRPYDFVLTKENFLSVVKNYEEVDGYVVASPKYAPYTLAKTKFRGKTWRMLGEVWSRISNPLDPTADIPTNLAHFLKGYKPVKGGFVIGREDIKRVFFAKDGISRLLSRKGGEKWNKVRRSTKKLVNLLRKVVLDDNLGLTGSSLFGAEIEDFSDIDLVIYGSGSYKQTSEFLRETDLPGIHFRTKKEWEAFYDQYNVVASVGKEQFARHMLDKYDQFSINEIPVSVLAVRNNCDMRIYLLYKKTKIEFKERIEIEGRVSDDSESMFLSSFYKIDSRNEGKYYVYNENRAFLFQAQVNERVVVRGESGEDLAGNRWINITSDNRGFIVKAEKK